MVARLSKSDKSCRIRLVIERLELHRLHADLTMCFKIVHGLVALQSDNFFNIDHDHITRSHSFKLFLPPSRVNCRKHFLLEFIA